jgi:hypothetical protein
MNEQVKKQIAWYLKDGATVVIVINGGEYLFPCLEHPKEITYLLQEASKLGDYEKDVLKKLISCL